MPGRTPYARSTFVGRERERSAPLDALRTHELAPLRERYEAFARRALGDERWELAHRGGRRTDAREALYSWLDGPD
ncbi:hypothetical protein [Streptomyces sp. NRRL F-5630]|uniref:hypothetical protein n=1 Tax=Streptomyces sp. NRRL F-5630 TaxID=1463864 RepID=UPI003D72C1C2